MNMFSKMVDEFSNAVMSQDAGRMMNAAKNLYQTLTTAISSTQLSFDHHSDAFEKLKNTPLESRGEILQDFLAFTIDDSQSSNTLYMFHALLELAESGVLSSVDSLIRSTEKRILSIIARKDEPIDLHDFSFLNSPVSKRPLLFGKPQKSVKVYPQVSSDKLALMHTSFFSSDKGFVQWFDAEEKKKYKIRKNESNRLYVRTQGKEIPLTNEEMIFALSPKGGLYAVTSKNQHNHSSFLAGQPVICAGELEIQQGKIVTISALSGHYLPSTLSLLRAVLWLYSTEYIDEKCMIKFYRDTKETFGITLNKAGVTVKELLDTPEMQDIINKTMDEMKISLPKRPGPGSMRV